MRSLTDQQVIQIREMVASGKTKRSVALELEIPYHVVTDITKGKTYKDVDGPITQGHPRHWMRSSSKPTFMTEEQIVWYLTNKLSFIVVLRPGKTYDVDEEEMTLVEMEEVCLSAMVDDIFAE